MTWERWQAVKKGIGKGGQGSVHLVKDTKGEYSGKFALKELNSLRKKQVERFKNEIEAILKLDGNPNIVSIVDKTAFKNESPFYVMELADSNLFDIIIKKPVDINIKFKYFLQICEGVKSIHQNDIIHRDLKPQNILIKNDTAKISDFGICLIVEDINRLTAEKEVVGPRFYMAPEQEDGRNLDVDNRADIYSLGKILYFILSDGKIFNREKYMNREYNLSKLKDKRYGLFTGLFSKSINQWKESRYSDVQDLTNDFIIIRDKFLNHPKTKLEAKVNISGNKILDNIKNLEDLSNEEFNELLEIAMERKLLISEEFLNFSITKLSEKTVKNLLNLFESNPHLLIDNFVDKFTSKFIINDMKINLLPNGNNLKAQVLLKAIENKDTQWINSSVEKYNLLHLIRFDEAKVLLENYSLLNDENKKKLLLSLAISPNEGTRDLVTKINIKNEVLSEAVKRLLEVGIEK